MNKIVVGMKAFGVFVFFEIIAALVITVFDVTIFNNSIVESIWTYTVLIGSVLFLGCLIVYYFYKRDYDA